MADSSRRVVIVALGANLAITAAKAAAGLFTGSVAMLTEAIHSLIDSGDQALILFGQHRAARPPDPEHPFGHGMELYFWAFVVSLLIFSFGGAASLYEGARHLARPTPIRSPVVNYLVLGAAFAFEGGSFVFGLRNFNRRRGGGQSLMQAMRASKDPALFIAVLEDAAALIGLSFAFLGVLGASRWRLDWADGAASVAIGGLLVAVALFLARETRSLLTGEAASHELRAKINKALQAEPRIRSVAEVLTLQMGASSVLVAVTLDFHPDPAEGVEAAAARLISDLRACDDRISRVFLSPAAIGPAAGRTMEARGAGVRRPAGGLTPPGETSR